MVFLTFWVKSLPRVALHRGLGSPFIGRVLVDLVGDASSSFQGLATSLVSAGSPSVSCSVCLDLSSLLESLGCGIERREGGFFGLCPQCLK